MLNTPELAEVPRRACGLQVNEASAAASVDFHTSTERLVPEPTRSYAHRLTVFMTCLWSGRMVLYVVCRVSGPESFGFLILPSHTVLGRRCSSARLCVSCPTKTTTTSGPAPWLAACVLGVERRYECSDVAWMAYGACASDGRSADAWTERAPILRGREGVNPLPTLPNPG